jgi:hypothetical protein
MEDNVGLTLTSEADPALSSAASRRCESPVLPACLPSIYAYHLCTELVYVNCVYCQGQRQALKQPVMLWISTVRSHSISGRYEGCCHPT